MLLLTHAREARITSRPCGVQVVTWAGRVHIKIDQLHISRHYTLIIIFLCLFNSPPGLIYCGGSYSYFTQLFFNQRLCQWRPNSGTNTPIWQKYCRHSLQPIDRIFAKFGPDQLIGSRVRASLSAVIDYFEHQIILNPNINILCYIRYLFKLLTCC